jgi:hypothetical protein
MPLPVMMIQKNKMLDCREYSADRKFSLNLTTLDRPADIQPSWAIELTKDLQFIGLSSSTIPFLKDVRNSRAYSGRPGLGSIHHESGCRPSRRSLLPPA